MKEPKPEDKKAEEVKEEKVEQKEEKPEGKEEMPVEEIQNLK